MSGTCVECKYYYPGDGHRCNHPEVRLDPITGDNKPRLCMVIRATSAGPCGREGRLWERRDLAMPSAPNET